MTNETLAFIADICTILGVLASILWAVYRYLKIKRLYIPRQMLLAILLHLTIVYIVDINTDTPGIAAAVSVMLAALVYLLGDAYEDMHKRNIEEYESFVESAKDTAERATDVAKSAMDQSIHLVKVIEKLTGQSLLDEEDES